LVLTAPPPTATPVSLNPSSYLLQICGTTFGEWAASRQVAQVRARTTSWLTQAIDTQAAAVAATTVPMLTPATGYRVTGAVAWRRYRNATTATTDGEGTFPIDESFTTTGMQPTDLRPYVAFVDPSGPDQPQYCAEPVVVRFATDDVDALYAAFSQQVVTRLKADVGGDSANLGVTDGRFVLATASSSFEQVFAQALDAAPCIPGDALLLFPTTEVRSPHPLQPNTGYTMSLVPRDLGEPGALDPAVWDRDLELAVESGGAAYRSFLRSSRYPTFTDHVAAYRTAAAGAGHLLADDAATAGTALAALPPLPAVTRGDAAVDALLLTLVGSPITIPGAPEVLWLWGLDSPAADGRSLPTYRLLGLLLDGPEPLLRRRPDGTDSVSVQFFAGTPAGLLHQVAAQVVTGTTGARLLAAVSPGGFSRLTVRLSYQRSAGDVAVLDTLTLTVPTAPGAPA
jgi:hypothetical protein